MGAGAAGVFAALRAKELNPSLRLLVVDRAAKPLRKVSISGGGRCNVTHDCDDLDILLGCYPRGGPRLEALLTRFMPYDTVDWFRARGVSLKTEPDGRMFPVTDSSQTIIDCLMKQAHKLGIELRMKVGVKSVTHRQGQFSLLTGDGQLQAKRILLATGGASRATEWLTSFGHRLAEDIPSLFTFCVKHPAIDGLQGLSVPKVRLRLISDPDFESEGPLLITHWGISGPAVLKLSAFSARELAKRNYHADLLCDLLPDYEAERLEDLLEAQSSPKQIGKASPFAEIPKRLWSRLIQTAGLGAKQTWNRLTPNSTSRLIQTLKGLPLQVVGKGVFKEEFVTSGGVELHEIDIYTMESRRVPGLFVAGELLNVDGITGGFNFQNAWASGFVAGEGLAG